MKIKLHGGDFLSEEQTDKRHNYGVGARYVSALFCGDFLLVEEDENGEHQLVEIGLNKVKSCVRASDEDSVNFSAAAGIGAAGALLLGPIGLLGGAVLGGLNKKVTYIVEFDDGKKFLGTSSSLVFKEIETAIIKATME